MWKIIPARKIRERLVVPSTLCRSNFELFFQGKKVASQEMERYERCYIEVVNSQLARNKSFVDTELFPLSRDIFLHHLLPLLPVYCYMRSLLG